MPDRQPVLWLLIGSEYYYPGEGVSDWILCTPDGAKARAMFEAKRRSRETKSASFHLVALNGDGTYSEVAVHAE